ncbi:sulfatase-like hydrolase/transferase [bacterium]|nr:sulfatase-like hydrolase/transferase [bacterium]
MIFFSSCAFQNVLLAEMNFRSFRFLQILCLATSHISSAKPPSVVYILSDNQSYYEMGCHGHAQIKTPHIDRFAEQSVEFTHFYAPPYCSPSRAVILTGQHAMRSGVFTTIAGRAIMHRDQTTLPDILKKNGYSTGIFGKWHLGFSYPHRPKDRGFDEVFIHRGGGVGQMEDYYGNSHYDTTFIHNDKVTSSKGFSTDTLFDRAMDYVEAKNDQPFFCFVSTPVTHSPHHGPKDLVAELKAAGVKGDLGLFAQVQNLDTNIGRMLDKLDALGLSENTIVIYASDQGMNDRGAPHGGNRLGIPYDPAQHVPFFIRVPGAKPQVCERLAGMIDFFPTILDFCGVDIPENSDGVSLKPLVLGKASEYPKDRRLIIQCPRGRVASKWKNSSVKTERWRLVDGEKLYDIKADPRQKTDVAVAHGEVVKKLRANYETYWASLPDQATTLSRHLIGAKECPQVMLNGMDWYAGGAPWARSHFGRPGNGKWAVSIVADGRYEFECRRFPREADKAMEQAHVRIQVGNVTSEVDIAGDATFARFELDLKAGDYDLQTWLSNGGKPMGALFVYISKK